MLKTAEKDSEADAVPAPGRARPGPTWPRLPVLLELVTLAAAYAAPSLVRLVLPLDPDSAFRHAHQIFRAEVDLGLNIEPALNHLVAGHAIAALSTGYYYGLLHFILTPAVLVWLYLRRPAAFPRLRSSLAVSTLMANIVFWTWAVAPPRFATAGMTDVLVRYDILGSADPHGVTGAANLYAAMPSLHVAWATWCAMAVVIAGRSRWRHLAWLYPAATTFVVLASANHFMLDVLAGAAVAGLGLAATMARSARPARPAPLRTATQPLPPAPTAATPALAGRPGVFSLPPDIRLVTWPLHGWVTISGHLCGGPLTWAGRRCR